VEKSFEKKIVPIQLFSGINVAKIPLDVSFCCLERLAFS